MAFGLQNTYFSKSLGTSFSNAINKYNKIKMHCLQKSRQDYQHNMNGQKIKNKIKSLKYIK